MLLIIPGVIGGLIGFGIIGLFIGPVILAVTYTLLRAWIARDPNPTPAKVSIGTPIEVPEQPSGTSNRNR
jgi:predicted PurR-regulated permease PerM